MKRFLAFALCLLLLFSVGCEKKQVAMGEEMISGGSVTVTSRKPDTFNPLTTSYESVRELLYLFYDGLFYLDEKFEARENLASNILMADDYKSGTITLKSGVTFADGSTLTSEDVIYTVNFIKENSVNYEGAVKNIKSIAAVDTHTIRFELYTGEANFKSMLTFPIIRAYSGADMSYPNGTGQFIAEKDDVKYTSLHARSNPSYHMGRAYLDGINVIYANTDMKEETTFLSGGSNILVDSKIEKDKLGHDVKIHTISTNRFEFLGFNSESGLFTDETARRAIYEAIKVMNLSSENENIKNKSMTPINPNAFFAPAGEEVKGIDIKASLTENGWVQGGKGVYKKGDLSFSFEILVNKNDTERLNLANFISRKLIDYGIYADVTAVSYEEYKERLQNKNYDAFIGGAQIGNPMNLSFLFSEGQSTNVLGYKNGVMDARLSSLNLSVGEERTEEAKKFIKAFPDLAPLAGLYFKDIDVAVRGNVTIPSLSPTSAFVTAYTWYMSK